MRKYPVLLFLSGNIHDFGVNACSEKNECSEGQWCSSHSNGTKFCKEYAALDEPCNFFAMPEDFQQCNPFIHKCYEPRNCIIADIGGTCVEDSKLLEEGDCCFSNEECASGLCNEGKTSQGTIQKLCGSKKSRDQLSTTCLIGDILYSDGDIVGHFGYQCLDDSMYEAVESFCKNGEILEKDKVISCPLSAPICNRCGGRGIGNARCLSSSTLDVSTQRNNNCIFGSEWASLNPSDAKNADEFTSTAKKINHFKAIFFCNFLLTFMYLSSF